MRFILLALSLVSLSIQAAPTPVQTMYENLIHVTHLQKTEVAYDATEKAWFLNLAGVMTAPDYVWKTSTMKETPQGVTAAIFRPPFFDRFERETNYYFALGMTREHKKPFGVRGAASQMSWGHPFEARVRLPSDFHLDDRSLRLTFPASRVQQNGLVVVLNWDALNKTWALAFGSTNPPALYPHPNPLVRIVRYATQVDVTALKLPNSIPSTTLSIEADHSPRVCPGNSSTGELAARSAMLNDPQLALLQLHEAKSGALDPWGESCTRTTAQRISLEAVLAAQEPEVLEASLRKWGFANIWMAIYGVSAKDPKASVLRTIHGAKKSGDTEWKLTVSEETIRPR